MRSVTGKFAIRTVANTVPAYLAGMADYESRQLTGAIAPADGNESMEDITPSEWLTNDPGDLENCITDWSGGGKGFGSILHQLGGGHLSSANNGQYIYDFNGGARPNGWTQPLDVSAVADIILSAEEYADGYPSSIHPYDNCIWADHNSTFYRFGGANYAGSGFDLKPCWKHNNPGWTRLPDLPTVNSGTAVTFYDSASKKVFIIDGRHNGGYFFNLETELFSSFKGGFSNQNGLHASGSWDPTRNRGISITGSDGERYYDVDFGAETVTQSVLSPSGSTGIFGTQGASVFYDSVRDSFWIFGGRSEDSGYSNIYEMDAGTFNVTSTSYTITGVRTDTRGSFGRFCFEPTWRILFFLVSHNEAPWAIKLPS